MATGRMQVTRFQECAHLLSNGLSDQGRHGIADKAELVRPRDGKLKPVGKTLHARSLARCQGAVLRWVDEH